MRVNKDLRDLLLRQAETYVLSPRWCIYRGIKYTYTQVTHEESLELIYKTQKLLDKKSWAKKIIENFRGLKQ